MSGFTVRPMTEDDIPAVAEIERLCFSSPWSETALRQSLAREGAHFFVLCEDGTAVGYISGCCLYEDADIYDLAVHPSYRRHGYGRALLQAFLQHMSGVAHRILLDVRASNAAAIALYESCGFSSLGIRRGFYEHPVEDGITMEKILTL